MVAVLKIRAIFGHLVPTVFPTSVLLPIAVLLMLRLYQ